ncbi:MAG: hypothetical protein IJ770_05715 [Alphaproteobacteria bacterium]|nr:hypothetical protein [Alphaproteobacteria bacterium]
MKKIAFITMFGAEIKIDRNLLLKEYVEQASRKHFKQEVICTPCVYGSGSVAVGWRIESKKTAEVIGYLGLTTGNFCDYPADFEYGVTVDVPLGKQWARFFDYKVRFIDTELEICKCK